MKIALLEPLNISEALLQKLSEPLRAQGHEFTAYDSKAASTEELAERCRGCEILMIANRPFPAEAVAAADKLRMLCVAFTGTDHVAAEALRERGILLCNASGYSDSSVAEMAVGMTLSLLRKLSAAENAVRSGGSSAGLMGREICGRTVGIIGTGHIGLRTARLYQAFGARVIAYSRSERPEAAALGIPYVSLEELLRRSDIVSLHVPNNASTRRMLGREQFALMKRDALFINCARGPVVDSAALSQALNEGRLGGAAVDVFDREPPLPADEPLLHAKNCLLTPHTAFLTEEAMVRRAEIAFANVEAYLVGKPQNLCL